MSGDSDVTRNTMVRAALAAVLFLAALFFWWGGGRQRELAAAQRALVTLQFDEAANRFSALAERGILDRLLARAWPGTADVATSRAVARYWSAPSAAIAASSARGDRPTAQPIDSPSRATSPPRSGEVRATGFDFLAANAAYREATESGGAWRALVGRLDGVIEQYAAILRSDPGHRDAAFNYEFVVRYRTAIAARQRDVPPAGADDPVITIHGIEGTPPPGSGTKQFRMLVPMQPDERQEAEQAGRGGRRIRKG